MEKPLALSDEMKFIFENVNKWLHYAEAKNAVLVGFCGAGITALGGCIEKFHYQSVTGAYCISLMFFLSAALLLSLLSFIPQTRLKFFWHPHQPDEHDNLYF